MYFYQFYSKILKLVSPIYNFFIHIESDPRMLIIIQASLLFIIFFSSHLNNINTEPLIYSVLDF